VATLRRASAGPGIAALFASRAARAETLRADPSRDAEPLALAAVLLRAQGRAAEEIEAIHGERPLSGDLALDLEAISATLHRFLATLRREGPAALATLAESRASDDARTMASRLLVYWNGEREVAEDFLSRALLRPYVETLRASGVAPRRARARGRCPACGGGAGVGRRRSEESQGAVRSLLCALCGFEWAIARIRCPACSEHAPGKLPSFTSPSHPTARIEACETCRRYVKTLDTTFDERALPEVDDLASLALDLWAREQGFVRIEPGVAG